MAFVRRLGLTWISGVAVEDGPMVDSPGGAEERAQAVWRGGGRGFGRAREFGYHAPAFGSRPVRLAHQVPGPASSAPLSLQPTLLPGMNDKIRRTLTSILPIAADRQGECNNCGACCKLPRPCAFLGYKASGESYCRIYKIRPLNCRKYPRTATELVTADTCGYTFAGIQVTRGTYAPEPVTSQR